MAYYKTGVITVAAGGDVVIGTGTAWVDNVRVGDMIRLPNGQMHEILSRSSDTELAIYPAYSGPSADAQPYFVTPVPGYGKKLYDELALAVRQFGDGAEKLEGVAVGATKNSTDAHLLARENHSGKQPLSTISDAGDAAAKNVVNNKWDMTAGAVLTNGAFGIGNSPIGLGPTDDLNDWYKQNALFFSNNAKNSPYAGFYGWVTNKGVGAGQAYCKQIAESNVGGHSWQRTLFDGAWGNWAEVGSPERGGTANGEYVRFPDGTQICFANRRSSSFDGDWVFPAAFVFHPAIQLMPIASSVNLLPRITSLANDRCGTQLAYWEPYAKEWLGGAGENMAFTAIGRWK